jgi:hypothetical protein
MPLKYDKNSRISVYDHCYLIRKRHISLLCLHTDSLAHSSEQQAVLISAKKIVPSFVTEVQVLRFDYLMIGSRYAS